MCKVNMGGGLSTQPCGKPVLRLTDGGDMGAQFKSLGAVGEKVHNTGTEARGEAQLQLFSDQNSWYYCVKSGAVVHKEHLHIGPFVLQVLQCSV